MKTDRGATEVLGYVLVFAVVTATIAVVMTTGISGLESSQQAEQTNNMERAFDVLGDNFRDIYQRDAPSRATEIRLQDGDISYGQQVSINVTNGSDAPIRPLETVLTEPIVYEDQAGTKIVYEGGAIIREQDGRSVMLQQPDFILDAERTVVPFVRTRPISGSPDRLAGPGTVLIGGDTLRTSHASEVVQGGGENNVTVEIESPRADAWESYFRVAGSENSHVVREGNRVIYEVEPSEPHEIVLIRHRIRTIFRN